MNAKTLKLSPGRNMNHRGWGKAITHTHTLRGGSLQPPEIYENMVDWTSRFDVSALGIGSPWTPATAALYRMYDGEQRNRYYSGNLDPETLRRPTELSAMLESLNTMSEGKTHFYIDNETPKGRYGHLWWLGWEYDFPPWHDYDQPYDIWMTTEQPAGYSGPEPVPYERRPYLEIIATQRARGALGVWAHPTSWWRGDNGAFITNIASELPSHLLAQGRVDGMTIMGYDPYHASYLGLWFHLLDSGYKVTGSAESDSSLSNPGEPRHLFYTWYKKTEGDYPVDNIKEQYRNGSVAVSNGIFINMTVDGKPMGSSVNTSQAANHRVHIKAFEPDGEKQLTLQLRTGYEEIVWQYDAFPGGEADIMIPGSDTRRYLVAMAFGRDGSHRDVAISNPVYLEPAGFSPPAPVETEVRIEFRGDSHWIDGVLRLQNPGGNDITSYQIRCGTLSVAIPADSRLLLQSSAGAEEILYLMNINPRLQDMQRYLYRGRFLIDYPGCKPGEIPYAAFNLRAAEQEMSQIAIVFSGTGTKVS